MKKLLIVFFLLIILPGVFALDNFRFVALGDTRTNLNVLSRISDQAYPYNPVFIIHAGDLEDTGFTNAGGTAYKNSMNGILTGDPTPNGLFDKTFVVRGNHDGSNLAGWQAFFNFQQTATNVGATNFASSQTDIVYSFDYGNSHFVALDAPGDFTSISSAQITWLNNDLTAAEGRGLKHAFILFHGPLYPVDGHCSCTTRVCTSAGVTVSFANVINAHPIVEAMFVGHEHIQAYVKLDNTRIPELTRSVHQFITGSAAAPLHTCDKTYRFDFCGAYYGFATVDVNGSNINVTWYKDSVSTPQYSVAWTGTYGVVYNPADTDQDGCISLGEISAYVSAWMQGEHTLGEASNAVSVWLGGCYI